jgi:hypothetical protein
VQIERVKVALVFPVAKLVGVDFGAPVKVVHFGVHDGDLPSRGDFDCKHCKWPFFTNAPLIPATRISTRGSAACLVSLPNSKECGTVDLI